MAKEWALGDTSQRYETGNRGAGTISTGKGDHGGVSYGSYQLSSKTGTLREYLDQSPYRDQFAGMTPATPEFNAKWRELAKTDPAFAQDQHEFIRKTHYDVQVNKLEKRGIDLSDRGPAVQDALWSTSVQFRNLTPGIVEKGLKEKFGNDYKLDKLSDKDIVEAIQDYKIEHNKQLFSKSPKLWDSLEQRAQNEKADLVKLAERERTQGERPDRSDTDKSKPASAREADAERIREAQNALNALGVKDARGHALEADGKLGPRTREAVEAFQKEHGLTANGRLDADTAKAIGTAAQQRSPAGPDMADPSHRYNEMYKQALGGIEKLGPQTGLNDEQKRNAAAAIVYEARVQRPPLDSIDHVVASQDGKKLFAVEGNLQDPSHKRLVADTAQAGAQPVAQSTKALDQDEPQKKQAPEPSQQQQSRPIQV
ncbi:peptidoglycan-binding domain-containing protein [Lysobacter enzymogenes]|uniref:Peptidoglycan-binding protein n=1 Tax=Lysobacter enzymogenes TaxID=69 RepID=A0AAU9AG62_LYSEN|nr:peptidoglycan-binding domain-containing protein [Lysobacter enzymogenes]BAV95868.1 conserved hypothetical protein [Lysobacter enzymogenes]